MPIFPYFDKAEAGSSHTILISWLSMLEPGMLILDIGTATGTLGRLLAGKYFTINGIEPHPEWAAQAEPYYNKLITSSVETALQTYPEILTGYDVVVFADVLEHLVDPDMVLRKVVELQPDQSIFLISLPNIANIWVRINLLFGRFEYQERGILDRTHLHFYTRKTIILLVKTAGLNVQRIEVTPIPLSLVHPFFVSTIVGRLATKIVSALTKIFPQLLGYQFVLMAEKRL